MPPQPLARTLLRHVCLIGVIALAGSLGVRAQEAPPPAYLGHVAGQATLDREGVSEPATENMPFVPGDRLRTEAGRVEILFPDGSGIEVGEYSEVEAISTTRVRLMSGTMDHIDRPAPTSSQSASYLPSDLRNYGSTFDQYGSWQSDPTYGYVWYPTVGPEWRPYYYGSWSPIRSYGWTWVGLDPWAWPTHHYGRWGYARNAWFWIPGRTWGAAWVSWSFSDDYVSWCPLGYDSRPVFAISIGSRRAWDYWTVPRRGFGARGSYVGRYAGRVGGRESIVGSRDRGFGSTRANANDRRPNQTLPGAAGRVGSRESRVSGGYQRPTTDYRRPTTDYRRAATDTRSRADVAVPRPSASERVYTPQTYRGERPSTASRPSAEYRRPTTDYRTATDSRRSADYSRTTGSRPNADYRRPSTEYRRPTIESRRPAAAASSSSGGSRSMPHERAGSSGGGGGRARGQERGSSDRGGRRR